jgi:hypothetical protein
MSTREPVYCPGCGELMTRFDAPPDELCTTCLVLYADEPLPSDFDPPEPPDTDTSDAICPTCGDPDCSRPWGHPLDPEGLIV